MKKENAKVSTKGGESWEYTSVLPDSVDEAKEVFGEEGTLFLIHTSLIVKQQGIARDGFRKEASREDTDAAIALYKPGSKRGGKGGLRKQVLDRVLDDKGSLAANAEVRETVREAIKNGDWGAALDALNSLEG